MSVTEWQSLKQYDEDFRAAKRLLVGYSGGVDSHVLLHLLQSQYSSKVVAIHVNHGLSSNADAWQLHCENTCEKLGIELIVNQVNVINNGKGLEDAAREQRYNTFHEYLKTGDQLLLAHHQSDQVETVLFRLFRGAGVKGLGGIQAARSLAEDTTLLRPLLNVPRSRLVEYAKEKQLHWIDDESNFDQTFDRNFIRGSLLPLISQRWLGVEKSIARSAQLCRESDQLNNTLAELDLIAVGDAPINNQMDVSLDLTRLNTLEPLRQKNLIRFWLYRSAQLSPGYSQLADILTQMVEAQGDTSPLIHLKDRYSNSWVLRRYRDRIYLMPGLVDIDVGFRVTWQGEAEIVLPGNGVLTFSRVKGRGVKVELGHKVEIGYRQGGERFHPMGRQHSQSLKKLFQEAKVPPWRRDRLPLLMVDGAIISIVSLFDRVDSQVASSEEGLVVSWDLN